MSWCSSGSRWRCATRRRQRRRPRCRRRKSGCGCGWRTRWTGSRGCGQGDACVTSRRWRAGVPTRDSLPGLLHTNAGWCGCSYRTSPTYRWPWFSEHPGLPGLGVFRGDRNDVRYAHEVVSRQPCHTPLHARVRWQAVDVDEVIAIVSPIVPPGLASAKLLRGKQPIRTMLLSSDTSPIPMSAVGRAWLHRVAIPPRRCGRARHKPQRS